jgi:ABC-2 type transport system permease protein
MNAKHLNAKQIKAMVRHDLLQLFHSPDYWIPMAVLGLLFFVIIPVVVISSLNSLGQIESLQQLTQAVEFLPEAAQRQLPQNVSDGTRAAFAVAVYLLSPVAIVVPLTISVAVGASSIVGEREKGTGEFLAHSPMSGESVYVGKLISAFVPGYLTTLVGFGLYSLLVNLMLKDDIGYVFFPTVPWIILILWVMPAFLMFGLSLILRISARVKSVAAAQQASSLITLPLIFITYGQTSGSVIDIGWLPFILGGVFWLAAFISAALGAKAMKRRRLLGVGNDL